MAKYPPGSFYAMPRKVATAGHQYVLIILSFYSKMLYSDIRKNPNKVQTGPKGATLWLATLRICQYELASRNPWGGGPEGFFLPFSLPIPLSARSERTSAALTMGLYLFPILWYLLLEFPVNTT
jgi:hypothetical protein